MNFCIYIKNNITQERYCDIHNCIIYIYQQKQNNPFFNYTSIISYNDILFTQQEILYIDAIADLKLNQMYMWNHLYNECPVNENGEFIINIFFTHFNNLKFIQGLYKYLSLCDTMNNKLSDLIYKNIINKIINFNYIFKVLNIFIFLNNKAKNIINFKV